MVGISIECFLASFLVVLVDNAISVLHFTKRYQVEKGKHTSGDISEGISCRSKIECAIFREKENCCSASFSETDKLCILTPDEQCFNGSIVSNSGGWSFIRRYMPLKLYKIEKNWTDAKIYCNSEEGRLATIENSHEFEMAVGIIEDHNLQSVCVWIGGTDLHDEGVFVWDGSSAQVSTNLNYWNSGQPNNYLGDQDCLVLSDFRQKEIFKYNDEECSDNCFFLCEIK